MLPSMTGQSCTPGCCNRLRDRAAWVRTIGILSLIRSSITLVILQIQGVELLFFILQPWKSLLSITHRTYAQIRCQATSSDGPVHYHHKQLHQFMENNFYKLSFPRTKQCVHYSASADSFCYPRR